MNGKREIRKTESWEDQDKEKKKMMKIKKNKR